MNAWPEIRARLEAALADMARMREVGGIIDRIRSIAREHGWAIGAHGSMSRDIDLIGVPWTAEACSADGLVAAIVERTGLVTKGHALGAPRPGGRRTVILFAPDAIRLDAPEAKGHWCPQAIDLSLMSSPASKETA